MKILVINAGSSSLKYQLIDMENENVLAKGNCERIGIDGLIKGKNHFGAEFKININMPTHTDAFLEVKKLLTEGEYSVINSMDEITAVGHRIVQGGSLFDKSVLVDDKVIEGIDELCDLAPLHNFAHLQGIRACREVLGLEVPEVVVFDNAFHHTMPPEAYLFPIPYEYYEKYKIRRYGFHGTSHRYVSKRFAKITGLKNLDGIKMITCHLGNGASIAAIKDGKVMDTSMGLTPLDGFMMGSRSGSLDPSVVTYIAEKEHISPKDFSEMLNKRSGVLGISGVSSDDRDIMQAISEGNERAALARRMQIYQIRKFIGSYVAAMDGVDVIIFTGGIGENVEDFRELICEKLTYLGIKIDKEVNDKTKFGVETAISTEDSKVKVYVIPTNEELMIARDTKEIVEAL